MFDIFKGTVVPLFLVIVVKEKLLKICASVFDILPGTRAMQIVFLPKTSFE
jgi:hypothetical protein